ncbi:hypothetical protein E2320_022737, partial [Naja naja]
CYYTYSQDNWPLLLSLAEFSYNLLQSLTSITPFQAMYGTDPKATLLQIAPGKTHGMFLALTQFVSFTKHFPNKPRPAKVPTPRPVLLEEPVEEG